jgi:hypothetical protein
MICSVNWLPTSRKKEMADDDNGPITDVTAWASALDALVDAIPGGESVDSGAVAARLPEQTSGSDLREIVRRRSPNISAPLHSQGQPRRGHRYSPVLGMNTAPGMRSP